ncbi:nuclear transport factor 2 family protein [bacterium]|nr:MAG: nuclear transport factor 2 family protein [bacterium]
METFTELADRYIAAWNETDPDRRRALIAATYTEGATYLDPLMKGEGHEGLHALVGGVQAQFPGYRFSRTGPVDAHGDHLRFGWALGPEGTPTLVKGTDFCRVEEGRLASVVGFLDQMPANL